MIRGLFFKNYISWFPWLSWFPQETVSGLQKGPSERGRVKKRQKSSKSVKKFFDTCRQFSRRAKNVKNRQKASKSFSRHFSTIFFARHLFSGPFCNPLRLGSQYFMKRGLFFKFCPVVSESRDDQMQNVYKNYPLARHAEPTPKIPEKCPKHAFWVFQGNFFPAFGGIDLLLNSFFGAFLMEILGGHFRSLQLVGTLSSVDFGRETPNRRSECCCRCWGGCCALCLVPGKRGPKNHPEIPSKSQLEIRCAKTR